MKNSVSGILHWNEQLTHIDAAAFSAQRRLPIKWLVTPIGIQAPKHAGFIEGKIELGFLMISEQEPIIRTIWTLSRAFSKWVWLRNFDLRYFAYAISTYATSNRTNFSFLQKKLIYNVLFLVLFQDIIEQVVGIQLTLSQLIKSLSILEGIGPWKRN